MKDFNYYAPTEVVFGEQSEEQVAQLVKKYGGTKVLVHYGGKSGVFWARAYRKTGLPTSWSMSSAACSMSPMVLVWLLYGLAGHATVCTRISRASCALPST